MAKQLMLIKDSSGQDYYVNVDYIISVSRNSAGNTEVAFDGMKSLTTKKSLLDVVGEVNHFSKPDDK